MARPSNAWGVWAAAVLSTFGVLETRALRTGTPTLSVWIRRQIGVYPRSKNRQIVQVWFAASLAWLAYHLLKGESDGVA